jgi:hypothetical protein
LPRELVERALARHPKVEREAPEGRSSLCALVRRGRGWS